MCGLSPLVLVSAMVGITVASLTGNTGAGWAAAAAVAAIVYLVARRRSVGMCGVLPSQARPFDGLRGAVPKAAVPEAAVPEAEEVGPGLPREVGPQKVQ